MAGIARLGEPREICPTGIEGLDHLLQGGIPRGNTVLISGSVGTGKTTLTLEFLIRGAERKERSLFLSLTESSSKLLDNARTFEFFRPELIDSGQLVLLDVPIIYERLGLDHEELTPEEIDLLLAVFDRVLTETGAERVVIDSLTSLTYRIRVEERIRDFMLRLNQILAVHRCTTLLVSEVGPQAGRYSAHGVEEAIVDGVILLGNYRRHGDILRVLQVIKMRGTPHSRAQYVAEMTPIGLLLAPHLKGAQEEEAWMAGDEQLGERLRQMPAGSAIALKLDPMTYADSYVLALNAVLRDVGGEPDTHTIYVSVTNPAALVWSIAQALDVASNQLSFVDAISHIMMEYRNPLANATYIESPRMLENVMLRVEYLLRKHPNSKNIVIFDSVNSLAIHNSPELLSEFLHILLNNLKSRGVLSILLASSDDEGSAIERLLNLVADESIVVRAREGETPA